MKLVSDLSVFCLYKTVSSVSETSRTFPTNKSLFPKEMHLFVGNISLRRDFFRSRQTVNLVISTVFFFDLTVIVEAVQFSVSEAVFVLFGFGCLKNCRQCVAEVHSTDFLSLGRSDLRLNSVYLSVCMQEIPYF